MTILKELILGKGYCVVKANNIKLLEKAQDRIVELARNHKKLRDVSSIKELREKLKTLNGNEINDLNLFMLSFSELSSMMVEAFSESVKKISGEALFLQRRAHIVLNISGNKGSAVMAHVDGMSGISPFAFTLWTPGHDVDDDTGVWILDQDTSMRHLEQERENDCVMGDDVLALYKDIKPARLKLGEAVIFNPYAMHGAVAHDNRLSRIGLSTRFQSRKYPLFIRNSEFYYPYQLSVKQPDYASMFQKAN